MIITCPQCHTKFRINTGLIKETGTRVRCSNCQAVFNVFAPPPSPNPASENTNANTGNSPGSSLGSGPGSGYGQPSGGLGDQPGSGYGRPASGLGGGLGSGLGGGSGNPPDSTSMEDMERELDNYFQNPNDSNEGYQNPGPQNQSGFNGLSAGENDSLGYSPNQLSLNKDASGRLAAVLPKRAENNPINLILGNGDSFVVPEGTNLKPPTSAPLNFPGPEGDLGLGADPISGGPSYDETYQEPSWDVGAQSASDPALGTNPPPFAEENAPPLRAKNQKIFSKSQKVLLLVLAVVAAVLVITTLFMSFGSGPAAEETAQNTPAAGATGGSAEPTVSDELTPPATVAAADEEELKLSLPSDSTSNHYIDNAEAGQLLVLAGLVSNDHDKPVSFIRLKAKLTDKDNKILAERQVFAGDFLTEDELKTLSMKDILSRLSLKGGQNGLNTNVAPGKSIPYMFVFDKLPSDLSGFTIEPISSEVAEATAGQG